MVENHEINFAEVKFRLLCSQRFIAIRFCFYNAKICYYYFTEFQKRQIITAANKKKTRKYHNSCLNFDFIILEREVKHKFCKM